MRVSYFDQIGGPWSSFRQVQRFFTSLYIVICAFFQVIGYQPRPLIKITPPASSTDRRVMSYHFVEAMRKLKCTFTPEEVEPIVRRINPELHGKIRSLFIVISDDQVQKRSNGKNDRDDRGSDRGTRPGRNSDSRDSRSVPVPSRDGSGHSRSASVSTSARGHSSSSGRNSDKRRSPSRSSSSSDEADVNMDNPEPVQDPLPVPPPSKSASKSANRSRSLKRGASATLVGPGPKK